MCQSLRLSESDLRFLVETVATKRTDHDRVMQLVRDKDDLLEPMLQDPKLLERIQNQREALTRISPRMLFATLLRAVRRDLEKRSYVYEVGSHGKRIPIFDAPGTVGLLSDPLTLNYLVEMLCSFVRNHSGVVYWKEHGAWHRRRYSDTDLDDLIELARIADPDLKPNYFQRIGDVALFWTGIYPDRVAKRTPRARRSPFHRTLEDYERDGRKFYELAAREPAVPGLETVMATLSTKFVVARSALNTLSDSYLRSRRAEFFE